MKTLFQKYGISPLLPYYSFDEGEEVAKEILTGTGRISISGVQPKLSAIVSDGVLVLTPAGIQGEYILKPAPTAFHILNKKYCPANEALTMQLASSVYGIETAENGLCKLGNGEDVYVTKRFDVKKDKSKLAMEDFASVAGLNKDNSGRDYKYSVLSYEECAPLIVSNVKASIVDLLKFFRQIVFNFLVLNDDAHLKNFTLLEYSPGDYRLSPAYDLMNTTLHIAEPSIFGLNKGLFKEGMPASLDTWNLCGDTFREFGARIGIPVKVIETEMDRFTSDYEKASDLISCSGLSDSLKDEYRKGYEYRKQMLRWKK